MATKIKASNLGASATTAITNIVTENSVDSALVNGLIDSAFIAKSTSDLSEGSNLYYTTSRGDSDTGDYIAGNRTYGNITTTGYIAGPATFTIDPAAVGDNTGTLVVAGNLQVDGTTTTINSTTMEVDDLNITLASGAANASAANGAGITVDGASATITYDAVADAWDFNKDIDVTGTVTADGLTIDGGGSRSLFNSAHIRLSDDYNLEWGGGFNYIRGSNASNYLRFATNASEKMRIDTSGNVGIGTSSPLHKFHIVHSDTGAIPTDHQIGATSSNTNFQGIHNESDSATYSGLALETRTSGASRWLIANEWQSSLVGDLVFRGRDGGTTSKEVMRLKSTGSVGIGTASPSEKLTIQSGNINFMGGTNDAQYIKFGDTDDDDIGNIFYYHGNNNMVFTTNASEAMRIDSSGNVGIGNSSPSTLGHTSADNLVVGTTGGDNGVTIVSGTTGTGRIAFADSGDTLIGRITYDHNGNYMSFGTAGAGEHMRIDSSGNVGIGTSSPIRKLTVTASSSPEFVLQESSGATDAKNWRIFNSGNNLIFGTLNDAGTAGADRMRIDSSGNVLIQRTTATLGGGNGNDLQIGDGTGNAGLTIHGDSTSGIGDIQFADGISGTQSYRGLIRYVHSSDNMQFWTAASEAMRIDANGNVGIGISNPSGYKLQVSAANAGNAFRVDETTGNLSSFGQGSGGSTTNLQTTANHMWIQSHHNNGGQTWSAGNQLVLSNAHYASGTPHCRLVLNTSGGGYNNGAMIHVEGAAGYNQGKLVFSTGWNSSSLATELMRLSTSSVLVGCTSLPSSSVAGAGFDLSNSSELKCSVSGTGNSTQIRFLNPNGEVGAIRTNGTATSYITSSDYRLKENITADWDATTRLKQLNPVRFNFISDADTTVDGFLAHEVQDIVPEAISGTKDGMVDEEYEVTPAVDATYDEEGNVLAEYVPPVMGTRSVPEYQGIDQSKLVPLLVKTIQELEARITSLEDVVSPEKP